MARLWISLLLALLSLGLPAIGLEVTPGSSCAALCIDGPEGSGLDPASSSTNSSDIVCEDLNYHSTEAGIKFKNCVECLQKSEKVNGTESDISWFLYNIRFAVDTCLFGFPEPPVNDAVNSPCLLNYSCLPLKNALMAGDLDPVDRDDLGYCTAANNIFHGPNLNTCIQCLQASSNQVYISNFIIALEGGCRHKPSPGELIGLTGSIFSQFPVNITGLPTNQTFADTDESSGTKMAIGTIVGIAVGAGLLLVGGIALFIVYYRRQKKHSEEAKRISEDDPSCGSSSITAIGGGGHQPWVYDHKKSGSFSSYDMKGQQAYAHNADYYDDIEDEMRSKHFNFDPHRQEHGAGSALPTHPAYIPRAMSRISTRHPSPTPPAPAPSHRTSKSESYALQTYRSAPEDPTTLGRIAPPPPARMPQIAVTAPPPAASSSNTTSQAMPHPTLQNIPPPPPRAAKIPSIHLPSVRRMRVPKKYTPPKIVVEDASPIADKEESRRFRITAPLAFREHEERFKDQTLQGGPVYATEAPDMGERTLSDIPIGSGKSTLYGY